MWCVTKLITILETAPLLQDVSHPDETPSPHSQPTFFERVSAATREPLNPLAKFLAIATLVFLLLSSVFIGLFAGAQHKLNTGDGNGSHKPVTTTLTVTQTAIQTATDITTATATSTSIATTTVGIPAPAPTRAPEEVRTEYAIH